jgi:hypothetical protein
MLIDFLSIAKSGIHVFCEVARGELQQNCGSFVICSSASNDFEPPAGVKGTINGAGITLVADGKALPYRLRIGNKSMPTQALATRLPYPHESSRFQAV